MVAAFNFTNLIQMEVVVDAHWEMKTPSIIQTSAAPSEFLGQDVLVAIYCTIAENATIPNCLYLDYCCEVNNCKFCADKSYANIMIDASILKFSENFQDTHKIGGVGLDCDGMQTVSQLVDYFSA